MVSAAYDDTPAPGDGATSPADSPLEPGLERILTTAIDLFGRQGVKATSLRAIAEQAGVSPPLVIHHYGSKDGLRAACDERVLAFIRESKADTMRAGLGSHPIRIDAKIEHARPALRYIARTLSDASPGMNQFLDDLVEDAMGYTAEGVEAGLLHPSSDERARVIVLTLWSLGALVLHEHMQRLLGEDLLGDGDADRYTAATLELFSSGLLTERATRTFLPPSQGDTATSTTSTTEESA